MTRYEIDGDELNEEMNHSAVVREQNIKILSKKEELKQNLFS